MTKWHRLQNNQMSQQCHLIPWCFSSFCYYQPGKPRVGCMWLHALFFSFLHIIYLRCGIAISNKQIYDSYDLVATPSPSAVFAGLVCLGSGHVPTCWHQQEWIHLNMLTMPPVYLAWHIQVTKLALGFWWSCTEVANALAILRELTAINRAARTTATAACLQASTCHQAQKPF